MADLRKRFGELLAAHRRRRGLTQEALAEAAGLIEDRCGCDRGTFSVD
jgi:transcriptional regulator with XRE-family HTH domain